MSWNRVCIISRWGMAAMLAALVPFVPLPFAAISLVALVLAVVFAGARLARYELFVALVHLLAAPFVASSLWPGSLLPAALVLPGLPWLEVALRRAAASVHESGAVPDGVIPLPLSGDRRAAPLLVSLVAALVSMSVLGAVSARWILSLSAVVVLAFVGLLFALSVSRIPVDPFTAQMQTVRVLAGDTTQVTVRLVARSRLSVHAFIEEPYPWAEVVPRALAVRGAEEVRVRASPPLSGPSTLRARVYAVDPWGLVVTCQGVDLLALRVIPRAAYAAWLARRYLEQARPGGLTPVALPEASGRGRVRRGLEYYGARPYEPGDVVKDIFWKHTLKLGQIIVKERRDDLGEAVILAVNLGVRDLEDQDWLAFTLLMTSLTLAREGVPAVFAAYTHGGVVRVTAPLTSRELVRHALALSDEIRVVPWPARVLRPPQVLRLGRRVARLLEAGTGPAARLARILQFEYLAVLTRARRHPASEALRRAAALVVPPAAVLVLSADAGDSEAFEVALGHLGARGFHRLEVREMARRLRGGGRGSLRRPLPTAPGSMAG
jgi:uncharacterized protein (DUF58 family)